MGFCAHLHVPCNVHVFTDCQAVKEGLKKLRHWNHRQWQDVPHPHLWKAIFLHLLESPHTISCHLVRAHTGVPGNERAHALANQAARHAGGLPLNSDRPIRRLRGQRAPW